MFSWLKDKFRKPAPTTPEKPPERHTDDFSDPGQWFTTHRQLSRQQRAELLENPFPVTPDDFVIAGTGKDETDNVQPAKNQFRLGRQILPDNLFFWFVSQSFIGYQACAFIAQHWLVDRACSLKGRDAVKAGFKLLFDEGIDVPPKLVERIERLNKRYHLNQELVRADKFKNVFGISHILFQVESPDPEYYEKPFNPDGITPGSYQGMVHIDPYWISPVLDKSDVDSPGNQGFYEPTYWYISGRRYHRSHFVILRGPEVADTLKPSYLYGGLPLTQLIAERVYASERTANEAPQLALTKRLVIRYIDNLEQAVAQQEKFEDAMRALSEWRDNFGVYVDSKDNEVQQQDTSLSDLDVTIMTQYQIVAGQAGIPATKLMGTSPKGFNATGEHEISTYHEELESIQENDLAPIIDRHHVCLMRSHIAPRLADRKPLTIDIQWNPLAVMSARDKAETAEIKARTYVALQQAGAVDSYDIRENLIADEESGFTGLEAVARPMEEPEPELPNLEALLEIGAEAEAPAQADHATEGITGL